MAFIEITEFGEFAGGELDIDLIVHDPGLEILMNTIISIRARGWEEPIDSWDVSHFQVVIEGIFEEQSTGGWSLRMMPQLKQVLLETLVTRWSWY
jgi:hypothetical protein